MKSKRPRRMGTGYQMIGTLFLTGFLGFGAINGALLLVFLVKDRYFMPSLSLRGVALEPAYPDFTRRELHALLHETWSQPFLYEPFTQFKERPRTGRYVNVSEHGFRAGLAPPPPWPPDRRFRNVFLFGGSTAFGYGLPDHQTIAAFLQRRLPSEPSAREWRVYNFGRGAYYSSQERILFEQLLVSGAVPDLAIFVDGLNEFGYDADAPAFTAQLQTLMDGRWQARAAFLLTATCRRWMESWPMTRALAAVQRRMAGVLTERQADQRAMAMPLPGQAAMEPKIQRLIARYVSNLRLITAIGQEVGVTTVFVWQPVPYYGWDRQRYQFPMREDQQLVKAGYPVMAAYVNEHGGRLGKRFVWCADVQDRIPGLLYVDSVHYAAALSEAVAACMYDALVRQDLL